MMRAFEEHRQCLFWDIRFKASRFCLSFIALIMALQLLHSCARPPELIGVDNPKNPVSSVQEATRHKIYLASTRQATETVGALFSDKRAPELGLASVSVSIPPNHEVGKLERPSRLPPDPRKEFAIVDPTIYATDSAFISSVNKSLSQLPMGKRGILFFVHGYNNTTSDSLLRLAQFVEDSGFEGVALLFDWASAAKLSYYVYDMNSALVARPLLTRISRIMARTNADGFDIFVHSMGAFLTMEGIVDLVQKNQLNHTGRLRSVILASPDIDMDLFRSQLGQINRKLDGFYVLLSKDDSALKVSRRIAGGVPRVGAADAHELAELGVVAIDLSKVNDSGSGSHSKFADSPEVVKLLGRGLNNHSKFGPSDQSIRLNQFFANTPIEVVY
jgi:esterase/lipase superfamily enzyme